MSSPSEESGLPSPVAALPARVLSLQSFSYTAQTENGFRINGTIEAPDGAGAVQMLEAMRLRVAEVAAVKQSPDKALAKGSYLAFSQNLAKFVQMGMPIDKCVRLAAADMKPGRMGRAIAVIARELKEGIPLLEAFGRHRREFPPLYGRVIDAAGADGNLPDLLVFLGRHLDAQQRLRATLWRSIAGPLMTVCGLSIVLGLIGALVMPRYQAMIADMRLEVPFVTQAVTWIGGLAPYFAVAAVVIAAAIFVVRMIFRATGKEASATDRLFLRAPFVGQVLRYNLIARWLNVARIGVGAGLDLPAAIRLAGDSTASPQLRRDGEQLILALAGGTPMADSARRLIPDTVVSVLEFSAGHHELPYALQTLCDLYDRQAELRLERIPAILTPMLIMIIALFIGVVIFGVVTPLILLIEKLTNASNMGIRL